MNEFKFLEEIEDCLDEQFPKGKCKERGNALVLNAMVNIKFKELIKRRLERIDLIIQLYSHKKGKELAGELKEDLMNDVGGKLKNE